MLYFAGNSVRPILQFLHSRPRPPAFLLILALLFPPALWAQVQGIISDPQGEPLPFATVHLKGTSTGVTANESGFYQLFLAPGQYEIVFQYIGYASDTRKVTLGPTPLRLDITLVEAGLDLAQVVVLADREDPAYPIIREAIRMRPRHRARLRGYQCRAYIKGGIRLTDMPDTLLGNPVRAMMGADSSGYLYLSESESEIAFERPDRRREVMVASRVSGNASGFSFNRFGILDFQENTVEIGRALVNPIADNALSHYRYRLLQTYTDGDGREIHRIAVLPRRGEDPVFSGEIYILGEGYHLHSLDLRALRGNTRIELLDTFTVQQTYLPVEDGHWPLFQQTLRFRAGFLGFRFQGAFTAVTADYRINPEFPKGFFSREIMRVEEEANQKDELFWENRRPMPLTEEEVTDFQLKDSLADLRTSRPYMDSMDRIANRLHPLDFLTGYTYRQGWHGRRWEAGPVTDWYNAVQGWTLGTRLSFRKEWREQPGRQLGLSARYLYGFADGVHRWQTRGRWQANATDRRYLEFEAGHLLRDINPQNTFNRFFDAFLLLADKGSIKRYYDSRFLRLRTGSTPLPGWSFAAEVGAARRAPAINRSQFRFRDPDQIPPPNDDLGNNEWAGRLGPHDRLLWETVVRWQPGARYINYPRQRFDLGSAYPTFTLYYNGGGDPANLAAAFHLLRLRIARDEQIRTIYGVWSYRLEAGHFLSRPEFLQDFAHFSGNVTPVIRGGGDDWAAFRVLPVYARSSRSTFLQLHQEWDDQSYLFDKIPGVRRLGWTLLLSGAHLWTAEFGHWTEFAIGVGRIGFGALRPIRLHGVLVLDNGINRGTYLRISLQDFSGLLGGD